MDDDSENKKSKGGTKCVIKRIFKFNHYDDCLFNNKPILQRFKREAHNLYTEQVNKIALSSNDEKGLHTSGKIKTYPCGINAFKLCESEMLSK